MDIVLKNLLNVALKIAKFLNRYLLSPKSGSSSLAASGSLSDPLSHWVPVPAGPRALGLGRRPGQPGPPKSRTLSESLMPRPRQSGRQRSSSRALHSLRWPGPLGLPPPAARSRRPLLPVSGSCCCGPGTGTVVRRALPGPNLKNCQLMSRFR